MAIEPDEDVDERLRESFAVDEAIATRVATRALTGPRRRRARRWGWLGLPYVRASVALATVALCAGLAAWFSRPPGVAPPTQRGTGAGIQLSGTFVDGVLVVSIPGDGVVIAAPEPRDDRPRNGSGIVVVEGDIR